MEWKIAKKTEAKHVCSEKELKTSSFTRALRMPEQHPVEVSYGSFASADNKPEYAAMAYQAAHLDAEEKRAMAIAGFEHNKYRSL